jgi:hypothetical protein
LNFGFTYPIVWPYGSRPSLAVSSIRRPPENVNEAEHPTALAMPYEISSVLYGGYTFINPHLNPTRTGSTRDAKPPPNTFVKLYERHAMPRVRKSLPP